MSLKFSTAKISCTSAGCNFKTTRREYLKRHIQNRHERPKFNCEFCDTSFTTKVGWESHLKRHTGELHSCTVCDFKTPNNYFLKKHIEKHELRKREIDVPKLPNTHKCQLCGFLGSSKARVVHHARIHSAEFPYKCSIPGCDHRTKWKGNLKQHEDRHDLMKSTRFKCPMCPKGFCTDYQVTRHVRTHTQERTRECPDCDYRAATLIQVKRHQRRHHFSGARHSPLEVNKHDMEIQRNKIDVVAEMRPSLREGLRPVKISRPSKPSSFGNSESGNDHGGQRPSSFCRKPTALEYFPSKTLEKRRKNKPKSKTGKNVQCIDVYPKKNICSECGYATSRLKDHMRTHSDEKPFHCEASDCYFQTKWPRSLQGHIDRLHTPKKYICPLVGCDFESKDLILSGKHRRLHKLPLKKILQCPLCPKMYASKAGLDNHVLCHTGEKAFKCELCDYKAKTSFSVAIHFKCMHAQ